MRICSLNVPVDTYSPLLTCSACELDDSMCKLEKKQNKTLCTMNNRAGVVIFPPSRKPESLRMHFVRGIIMQKTASSQFSLKTE